MHPFLKYYHNADTPYFVLEGVAKFCLKQHLGNTDELVTAFLNNPDRFESQLLLDIIASTGNQSHAKILFEQCIVNNRLKPAVTEKLLETLGYLQYEPALKTLVYYALEAKDGNNYYTNMYAVFGLLQLQPKGLEQQITAAIEATFGKNIFCEYLPALAVLLPKNDALAQEIFVSGSEFASTDCNVGYLIALAALQSGIALQDNLFVKALFHPAWEQAFYGNNVANIKRSNIQYRDLWQFICQLPLEAAVYSAKVFFKELDLLVKNGNELVLTEDFLVLRDVLFANTDENTKAIIKATALSDELLDAMQGSLEALIVKQLTLNITDKY